MTQTKESAPISGRFFVAEINSGGGGYLSDPPGERSRPSGLSVFNISDDHRIRDGTDEGRPAVVG
ncbi:hypothetical protein BWR17_08860 [Phaeobacter inhibens]|nr:hypothetical protein BWR17_08860 [Phaeobacter inhibens]